MFSIIIYLNKINYELIKQIKNDCIFCLLYLLRGLKFKIKVICNIQYGGENLHEFSKIKCAGKRSLI